MKILFDHPNPFLLAHGGFQIQIEQTKLALESIGVEVEWLRWWDAEQGGDVIHYFGRPSASYIQFAKAKGIKIVISPLMTGMGSRSKRLLFIQKCFISTWKSVFPTMLKEPFGWDSFVMADASVALTAWEAHLMAYMFNTPQHQLHVVPNGVEEVFFQSNDAERGKWLVCTATITERKRVLELAQAALMAQTPLWIIGKPYSDKDAYAQRFLEFAKQHSELIRFEGPVTDRVQLAGIYRQARGFVLLSDRESLSLSALEAAACRCPLLLSDLPWATSTFGESASYCPVTSKTEISSAHLRKFYDEVNNCPIPLKPMTWVEIAHLIKTIYESIL